MQTLKPKTYEFGQKPLQTQQQRAPIKATHSASSKPLKSFKSGALQVAIWENENLGADGQPQLFRTVSFDRRYKDKNGEWKSSNNLRVNDLPKAALMLQKAYEYLILTGEDNEENV
jgi:hypothetical protein